MSGPGSVPAPSALRQRVESSSRPALLVLHRQPRWIVPLATVALVAVGLLAPPVVGVAALVVVIVFVAWIAFLSWPAVPTSGRLLRLLMLALVAVLLASRF